MRALELIHISRNSMEERNRLVAEAPGHVRCQMEETGLNLVFQDILLARAIENTDDFKIHDR